MPKLQNFSATRGNDEVISVVIESDIPNDTLVGAEISWSVYGMTFGSPIPSPRLIAKSTNDGSISVPGSPDLFFVINMHSNDTADLDLGNYYHQGDVVDEVGDRATIVYGVLALTLALE